MFFACRSLTPIPRNDLFSKKQYGFIKGRSTVLQLLCALEQWTENIEEGKTVDCIYADFKKAFDKVPHKRLMKKVRAYGIHENICQWIEDFLKDRKQRVTAALLVLCMYIYLYISKYTYKLDTATGSPPLPQRSCHAKLGRAGGSLSKPKLLVLTRGVIVTNKVFEKGWMGGIWSDPT